MPQPAFLFVSRVCVLWCASEFSPAYESCVVFRDDNRFDIG